MGKFFGLFGTPEAKNKIDAEPARFTRFEPAEERSSFAPDADKKFTRFAPQETLVRPSPVPRPAQTVARRAPENATARDVPAMRQPVFSDADNLNSEAVIPLSVFSKALPLRFSQMQHKPEAAVLSKSTQQPADRSMEPA